MTRIHGRIEFKNKEEKDFFYNKSKELGYSSFKDFALSAMQKEIDESNYLLTQLNKIADTACELSQYFSFIDEELTDEQEQVLKVANLIYSLAVHTDIMKNDPSNQVCIDDPLMLDEGEKPYWRNKHAILADFDINKYLNNE